MLRFLPLLLLPAAFAAEPDGATLYATRCAACHDHSAETRAPAPSALKLMTPENIVLALESGTMKEQGAKLSAAEKRTVAGFLGKATAVETNAGMCADPKARFHPEGPAWNGWGVDVSNTRFEPASVARLKAGDVPNLKLKWAFAFPNTFASNAQPVIVGGRIFIAGANRRVYSLDAKTGCQYWSMETPAPVRTAITVVTVKGEITRQVAFFGDRRATAYAVDASSGELLWKTHIDDHPRAAIVGAPAYFEGRVYVGLVAGEEGPAMNPQYECCTARGGLIALDAATGKQIWKTYTVDEKPHATTKNSAGAQMWGPSGASIWSAPTVDGEKHLVYAGTGDNFSSPPTKTSDAILAFDMNTGKIVWDTQLTEGDSFNMACGQGPSRASCPEENGPDFDIGASPILVKLANGKRVLLVSQKSGVAHGLDPDHDGKVVWETRVGKGGALGGIQWGSASDGKNMYVAVSDIDFLQAQFGTGKSWW